MAGGGQEKTEKATPKRKEEARKKGQVGRSADLNGAVVLIAALMALAATGGMIAGRMREQLVGALTQIADPSVVERQGLSELFMGALADCGLAVAPIAGACLVAGTLASVLQVGFKPSAQAAKPDPKRLNPIQGAKNILGKNALVEGGKSLVKVGAVGAIVFAALAPELPTLGALVGIEPQELAVRMTDSVKGIAQRAAFAYLLIGIVDLAWQKKRHEKSIRMDHEEIKQEMKQANGSPEVRAAMRRRAAAAARARMMGAVPEADVILTNPTHFSVALKYDGAKHAPEVVAKGQDIIAMRIREVAREHGVPIVPDPPLARALHANVEVGHQIPEEFFAAVAQVLAYVYRVAGRKVA